MEVLIKITTSPSLVQASGFIKDTLKWLVIKAKKTEGLFLVSIPDLVQAIKEQKTYAQKEVASFFADATTPVSIKEEECEIV